MLIGEKIRSLRRSKGLTQAELAEALSVSAQSVSKWEHHLSTPDISILPMIARHFGITMDELFNYRLDAMNYKERLIRFMFDNGMLRFGEFRLKSGRISPYLIHSGYYHMASQMTKLGEFYAEHIRECGIETNILAVGSDREMPLVIATGMALFKKYGLDSEYLTFQTPETSISGEITLITDTFTSGKTLAEALVHIKEKTGKYPSDIVVFVDRMEKTETSDLSAKHQIEKSYGVRIHALIHFDDILHAIERGVIASQTEAQRMKQYGALYKGV